MAGTAVRERTVRPCGPCGGLGIAQERDGTLKGLSRVWLPSVEAGNQGRGCLQLSGETHITCPEPEESR